MLVAGTAHSGAVYLGAYILQQMFDLTDRLAEQQVRDNAPFRLFCAYGLLKMACARPYKN